MRFTTAIALTLGMFLWGFAQLSSAQVALGMQPLGSFGGGPFDAINLGNLNVNFTIVTRHKAGRVTPFANNDLVYNSSIWTPTTVNGTLTWTPSTTWGWAGLSPAGTAWLQYSTYTEGGSCGVNGTSSWTTTYYGPYIYHDSTGVSHQFGLTTQYTTSPGPPYCPPSGFEPPSQYDTSSVDGYTLTGYGTSMSLTDSSGNGIGGPISTTPPTSASSSITDLNGNTVSESNGVWTDTLGQTALTVTGSAPGNTTIAYAAPSGANAQIVAAYAPYTVATAFHSTCPNVTDYNQANQYLVNTITMPDQSTYRFTYEKTSGGSSVTGRIAEITLPSGGTVQYSYGPINCADGTPTSLTRTLNPGGTWTYSRSQDPNVSNHWTTTITDPTSQANQTVIDFMKDATGTGSFYATQRKEYSGSSSSGTLLRTILTCFNFFHSSSCGVTGTINSPITEDSVFTYLPSSSGVESETDVKYSQTVQHILEQDSYDFGAPGAGVGPLIRKVATVWGYPTATLLKPTSVQVTNSAGTVVASTTYSYDQTAVTSTSNTPQHTNPTLARANLTQVATEVNGSTTLYERFTYYDTGMLASSTDAGTSTSGGPNKTSYTVTTCGNSFMTSISEPLSLSRSFTWDCNGGVMTSATDENGQVATELYTETGNSLGSPDADFWRPFGAEDQLNNGTSFTYPSETASESSMLFNGTHSVVDRRTTLDGFGRPIVSQTLQAPGGSTYDSVETAYDVVGRVGEVYRPYSAAAGATCTGTCPGITTVYDAINRQSTVTDGGGGTITSTYNYNDVLQVVGPPPTGENTKQKQLEYNGAGWLTSVCEVTSATGSGTCGQNKSQTGFWTKYTYDALGDLTGVTQNAQAASGSQQTRAYTFDMASRILTESNPETGSITYIYDSWDSSCGSYTSAGDLVEKKDAIGNVTCIKYDALHRATDITYPSGAYSSVTDQKHFVYDAATVNSVAMVYAKSRLAEAYTGTSTSKKTDEGFSYDARGEISDVYESTPNSGGYYHVNATYWASGKLDQLNGGSSPLPGLPAITYGGSTGSGLDGEGRITSVSAASGQNPVTSVSYNVAHQATGVTFGSSDSDAYQFDPNTGRMTQYTFNMGTGPTTDVGALMWNPNGTLQQLVITDHINTANSQTCTFGYDDLVRITSANCGSVWTQTFGFDPFGNLSKTGSAQFLPTYTGASGTSTTPTNQYYQISGGSAGASNYYDANGNLKNDVTHAYTWDADGNMISEGGTAVTMIYDALDRMAEQARGSAHIQIVYGPYGIKLALMNGQTLVNAFVKLPGGARAVYGSSGLAYYRHADHVGSSRLATTTSRTKYYDVAYAPYGEDYNGSGTQDLSFTDQNQDTVTGGWSTNLYDFMFREYRTAHGRWTGPDPLGLLAVNPKNPQSWNRYAYVINMPTVLTDFLGFDDGCYDDPDFGCSDDGAADSGFGDSGPDALPDNTVADNTVHDPTGEAQGTCDTDPAASCSIETSIIGFTGFCKAGDCGNTAFAGSGPGGLDGFIQEAGFQQKPQMPIKGQPPTPLLGAGSSLQISPPASLMAPALASPRFLGPFNFLASLH